MVIQLQYKGDTPLLNQGAEPLLYNIEKLPSILYKNKLE
jgi:hypothetical protein